MNAYRSEYELGRKNAQEAAKAYGALPMSEQEKTAWAKIEPSFAEFLAEYRKLWEIVD